MRWGRARLGNLGRRHLKNATFTTQLANVAAGEDVVLQFEPSFTNAPGMIETLTPTLDKDGQ